MPFPAPITKALLPKISKPELTSDGHVFVVPPSSRARPAQLICSVPRSTPSPLRGYRFVPVKIVRLLAYTDKAEVCKTGRGLESNRLCLRDATVVGLCVAASLLVISGCRVPVVKNPQVNHGRLDTRPRVSPAQEATHGYAPTPEIAFCHSSSCNVLLF